MKLYSYEIRESWSTDNDGNSYHIADIIAENNEQVDEWLHKNYNLKDSDDMSTGEEIVYSLTALYDENENEVSCDKEHDDFADSENECKEHYYKTDSVTAFRSEKPLNNHEFEYLKSGKHWCTVIDLTE